jgi:hypothetical protein
VSAFGLTCTTGDVSNRADLWRSETTKEIRAPDMSAGRSAPQPRPQSED